jgi:Flp pilus assembly pilin Flp
MWGLMWRLQILAVLALEGLAARACARMNRAHEGQGLFEYAIPIALIAVIAMVAVKAFGTEIGSLFERLLDRISGIG